MSTKITIYTRKDPPCAYCERAKALMDYYGVDFDNKIIGENISREEFIDQFPNIKTIPAVFFDDKFIGGYQELEKEVWNYQL